MKILTWHNPSNNGAFQKETELGIFSDLLTTKPVFSFDFTSMEYVEQADVFTIDGVPMTDAQKQEVLAAIESVVVPQSWKTNVLKQEPMRYLASTDYINHKYNEEVVLFQTTTQEAFVEKYADVYQKRAEARDRIRELEQQLIQGE